MPTGPALRYLSEKAQKEQSILDKIKQNKTLPGVSGVKVTAHLEHGITILLEITMVETVSLFVTDKVVKYYSAGVEGPPEQPKKFFIRRDYDDDSDWFFRDFSHLPTADEVKAIKKDFDRMVVEKMLLPLMRMFWQ